MNRTSFYTQAELAELGFREFGSNVRISRNACFYAADRIELGHDVRIDDFCVLSGGGGIKIGCYVHISAYSAFFAGSGIEMADFTTLSSRVSLYSESDDFLGESLANPMIPPEFKPNYKRGKIVLERHSIVGTNSTVMPGVTLAEGACVGAHSFVTNSCEAWTVYAGVPARKLKARSQAALKLEKEFLASPARIPAGS